jgi:8-oxo-dGTP diphosphatase
MSTADPRRHCGLSDLGSDPNTRPLVVVAAAVIEVDDRFLVTRRPRGVHLEGYWEFPGGKCEPSEDLGACLRREIAEELGSGAVTGAELLCVSHDYPERTVELHFIACRLAAPPTPLLGQEIRWVTRDDLKALAFPPADEALIAMLQA